MRDVPITQLRAFVTVARVGSFTRAADVLGYSQPAVHLQVSALRQLVGGPLLQRRNGRMQPTPLGQALLPYAERVVAALEAFSLAAARERTVRSQTLTVGVGRSSGSYVFPAIAALFREQHPDITLSLRLLPAADIAAQVAKGELDVGVAGGLRWHVRALRNAPHVVTVTYVREKWVFLVAPSLMERLEGLRRLVEVPCPVFLPEYGRPLQPELVQAFDESALRSRLQIVENAEIAKAAALAGSGIACIPRYASYLEVAVGDLVECLEYVSLPPTPISLAHRRPAANPVLGTFVVFLRGLRHLTQASRLPLPSELGHLTRT